MIKTLIKIVIALIVIHGAFRVGSAAWNYYRYEDALQQLVQFGDRKADKQLCDEALMAAGGYGVPIAANGLNIHRGNKPTYNCEDGMTSPQAGAVTQPSTQMTIEGTYMERLQILPGYYYPWEFKPTVSVMMRLY